MAPLAGAAVTLWFIHSFPTPSCGFASPAQQQRALHRDIGSQRKGEITLRCPRWFFRAHQKNPKATTKHTTRERPLFLCCCSCQSKRGQDDISPTTAEQRKPTAVEEELSKHKVFGSFLLEFISAVRAEINPFHLKREEKEEGKGQRCERGTSQRTPSNPPEAPRAGSSAHFSHRRALVCF